MVPPVELSINPIASCKTDVLVTEDPGEVRSVRLISEQHSGLHGVVECVLMICFPFFFLSVCLEFILTPAAMQPDSVTIRLESEAQLWLETNLLTLFRPHK